MESHLPFGCNKKAPLLARFGIAYWSESAYTKSKESNDSIEGGMTMELAKITSKGQITLPISIRRALSLKDGDKIAFVEMNGQYVLANPTMLAVKQLQDAFSGFAEENGLQDENDVVALVKEIRAERAQSNADHA